MLVAFAEPAVLSANNVAHPDAPAHHWLVAPDAPDHPEPPVTVGVRDHVRDQL